MATPDQDVRNRKLNPEARMELKEHLREFRDRFIKAAIATIIAAIIGTVFLYQPFIEMISAPLQQINAETGRNANLNYGSVASPFDQLLKVGMYIGMVIASPVWLYQALRFLLPALHTKEKKYLFGFLTAAIFAFGCGVAISYFTLPGVVYALLKFTPVNESNYIDAGVYISFILPVILVGINMLGLIRGKTILKSWRWVVVLVAVIAALTAPGSDIMMMFVLMAPLLIFFFAAIGICMFNDKRRDRKLAKLAEGADEATLNTATSANDLAKMGYFDEEKTS